MGLAAASQPEELEEVVVTVEVEVVGPLVEVVVAPPPAPPELVPQLVRRHDARMAAHDGRVSGKGAGGRTAEGCTPRL